MIRFFRTVAPLWQASVIVIKLTINQTVYPRAGGEQNVRHQAFRHGCWRRLPSDTEKNDSHLSLIDDRIFALVLDGTSRSAHPLEDRILLMIAGILSGHCSSFILIPVIYLSTLRRFFRECY